jgi:adenosylhomocysteine nucleosidase
MKPITHIGIISIWTEINPLLDIVEIEAVNEHLQARIHEGTHAGRKVTLAEVGMGKVQTSAVSQRLIDGHGVDLLISCGSAGAIDSKMEIGDVVLADRIVPHDFGEYTDKAFNYLGVVDNTYYDGMHYHRHLAIAPEVLKKAQGITASLAWPDNPPTIHTGCLVSGDQVIASAVKKRWLSDSFDALAVDMEAGAMAHTAMLNDLPWLAVRAVSDKADHSIDIDYSSLITYSDEDQGLLSKVKKSASTLADVAKDPTQLKAIYELQKGIKLAAFNAAFVTAAMIEKLTGDFRLLIVDS